MVLFLPASVDGDTVAEPSGGAVEYRATGGAPSDSLPEAWTIADRFGEIVLNPKKLTRVFLPGTYSSSGPPPALTAGMGSKQTCYSVRIAGEFPGKRQVVQIADAVDERSFEIRKPSMFCLAAEFGEEAAANAEAHRMCYLLRPLPRQPRFVKQFQTLDDFGSLTVDARKGETLCVPASLRATD